MSQSRRFGYRDVVRIVLVAAAYYGAARLSLRLALVGESVTPVWPPTGIAVVALLLFGRRVSPGILLAAFLVNLPISPSPAAAAGIAVGNTLGPLFACFLLNRVGFQPKLERLRDALAIVFLGALVGMLVSATVGTITLFESGAVMASGLGAAWSVWWTGDAMGVLIVAPFLLTIRSFRLGAWSWARRLEAIVLLLALFAVARFVFWSDLHPLHLVIPFIIWAAWRFRQHGATTAALLASAVAIWAAVEGVGPFSRGTLLDTMFVLQAFNASVALASLVLAALLAERDRAQRALERAGSDLEERVRSRTEELSSANEQLARRERQLAEAQELAHIGSWEWDIPTNVLTWTDELFRLFGLEPQSFPVDYESFLERVHEEDREFVAAIVERASRDHQPFGFDHRIVRADGTIAWLQARGRVIVDERGNAVKMTGSAQDISESKRAEEYSDRLREAERRQRQALALNDEVVQGLAVAGYALGAGDAETASRAVAATLDSARSMVSNLLGEDESKAALGPGDLVREKPATTSGEAR
ncbi:MAG TPA: MASE1 domain-containing protein [Actinomycetota bacterium]|jgi:PAS domain S-box-containing protein|nr:MASE1 domain-containing protein [Actinomycetota bacterium]